MRGLLKCPPLFITDQSPKSILGEDKKLFTKHFKLWTKNHGDTDKLFKLFSEEEIDRIGHLNTKLLDHGFRPLRFEESGEIQWGIVTSADNVRVEAVPKKISMGSQTKILADIRKMIDNLKKRIN